ncbi:mucin-binding protein [Lactobacillus johnsonii]|uniref:mucin-binding protein n=1 Tax=Lactobacillus johnsonii TaxID=33959 RepID=UPI0021B5E630|nr:YSIRK-type signal peptide-containing protein [Lactobacillus johnsonii]
MSKRNFKERIRKMEDRQDRFSIRKFSIGTVSVLIGSFIFGIQSIQVVHADTVTDSNSTVVTQKENLQPKKEIENEARGNSSTSVQSSQLNKKVGGGSDLAKDPQVESVNNSFVKTDNKDSKEEKSSSLDNKVLQVSSNVESQNQGNPYQINGSNDEVNNQNKLKVQPQSFTESTDTPTTPSDSSGVTITDDAHYPNTNGIVPANQYIFDQFTLTNGYTPLNMVITLATDRNNPGGNLNYYITNRDYSQVYASNTISVGQRATYSGSGPYPNSNLTIYNFGPDGISINENNYNFKLAFTFGYGKYDSIVNSNNSNPVANAWGDTTPSKATQTISYIDAETGEPMPDTTSITSSGLTGQTYQIDPRAEKIIKGYYLVNKERDHGVISQYKNGGTYTNEWVSLNGQFVKEVWHQINSSGVMQASIYINNVQQYDPNNPRGIVYPATLSNEGPTELTVSGRYVFPNPYVEQTTNIELKYATIGKIIPVDPNGNPIPGADQPQFPNDPNDPSKSNPGEKPNVPGWTPEDSNPTVNPSPKGPGENVNVTYVQEAELKTWKKDVSLTVKYVNSDGSQFTGTVPANASQSLNFSGEAYVSKVTGKLVNAKQDAKGQWIVDSSNTATPEITWTPESSSFSEVVSPVEAGYYLKNISSHEAGNNVEAISGITHTSDNVEVTVTYAPLGKMIPVDPSGKPIPDAPTPQFPNNPSDPSKGNPGNKPEVPGWTPVDPSKTVNPDPSDPGKNVPVPYAQVVAGTVRYIDDTTGKTLSTYDIPKGTVGSKINYSTTETINNYEKQGYVLVSNNYPTDAVYKVSGNDYQVHLVEGVQPITPDTPPTDVPTGTPENAQPSALKKDVSLTVKYVNSDGSQFTGTVPANASQSLNFSGEAYVSKVTGKLVNAKQDAKGQWIVDSSNTATPEITWTPESSSFSEVVSPVEAGYYLKNISSHEAGNNVEAISGITHTSDNVEVTVTYAPLGKMIPVDPSGKPIPDAPTPQFPNNPSDPSKGNPGNKPEVPGWTPVDPSKTVNPDPSDPGKNVPVPYAQVVAGTVRYIDDTTGKTLSTYDIPKGTVGSKINYSTTETINNYEKQGYVLVSNNYPTDAVYKVSGNDYQVHLVEGVQPITPDTPPTDVPTGTPENAQPSALKKDVSLTVKYVNSDGSQFTGTVPANASQSLNFSGEAYVSKVTGKLVNAKQDAKGQWIVDSSNTATPEITWTPESSSFSEVVSPVEAGYYLKNISSHEAGNNVEAISGITHTSDNVEVTVTYAPLGKMIPVDPSGKPIPDAPTPQFPNNPSDPSKGNPGNKPEVPGWTPVDPSKTVNPDPSDPGKNVPVPYAQVVAGTVRYIDDTTGKTLSTYDIPKGTVGSKINYSTTETINNYEKQGYVLVSNNYPTDAVYKVSGNDYQVHLVEGVQPITPDTPPTDVPTGTPENAQPSALKKDVSLTVKYVNSDGSQFTGTVPANASQSLNFSGEAYVSKVTGKLVNAKQDAKGQWIVDSSNTATPEITWTPESSSFSEVVSPVEAGYYLKNISSHEAGNNVEAISGITHTSDNVEVTVTYAPLGKMIPVDPSGKPIPDAPTPQFPNNPSDPSKGNPGNKPEVPGWTPVDPSKTVNPDPSDPGKNVPVPYAQVVAGTVRYIDDTTGKTLSTYDIPKGTVGSKINYSTTETINNYEKQGYVLVSNNYPTDAVYKVSGNDYQVHLVEGVQPITPDTPPTDVPTGTPENAQPSALKKDVSLTVKYVNSDGSQFTGTVPANASQSLNFSGEAYVSKVTGKLVNAKQDAKGQWIVDSSNTATPEITWTPESSSFSEVVSPVEAGYYLKNISSHEAGNNVEAISGITHTSDNVEVTVTYAPLGKMIPVDPSGKPIPDAPTPQFPNNPSDPSKGNPGNKPEVPGWTPVDPSKTVNPDPSDPGKNVPVPYAPNTPVQEEGSITVTVHDKTDNVDLPQYGKTSGEQKVGTEFTYDKNSVIQELENKGYKVLNPEVVIPTEITKGNQNIVIEVEHQLVPVTPENPGKPGEPINPNDPNGPKWPAGTDKDSLEKTGTQTIKYVAAGDKTPADNTQSFTFTRSAVVDKVTGKIVSEIGWNETSHTFGEVKTPEVSGYKADKEIAGGATITPDDLHKTIVVIYSPENPTQDTYNGSQTIKFVDPNGNELEPSNVQTATDLTGDHTFGIIDVPVINGYVSPVTTAGGATVTKDNPNAVITVVYTPVGRIIPVDPNGNPIPGQEHPQFPNNPNNPTEVIPGTKPNILGYHPENGKPGDPVNPVPGKPGEDVLVKYVPDTSTPKVPNKSTTPVKPETPAEQPAKSEKPATPSTPEKTNVSNKSEKVENTSINNIASQANKRTEKVVNKKAKTLPKTGAQNNEGVLAGVVGSALALFGLIGLIEDNKRKKKI